MYTSIEIAEAHIQAGELDDALEALTAHLDAHPDDVSVRRLRAQTRLRMGRPEELRAALDDYSHIPTLENSDLVQRSIIEERLGLRSEAIASMQAALQRAPNNERLTERLLSLYLALPDLDSALALIRQQPRTWRWMQWEADVLVDLGNDQLAIARYGLALAQLEQVSVPNDHLGAIRGRLLVARASAYRRLQQIDLAREHYQAAQQNFPNDPTIDFNLGLLLALEGDIAAANAQCRAAYQRANESLKAEMRRSLHETATYERITLAD